MGGWQVAGTSTGLCLVAGFVVNGAEHLVAEKRHFFFGGGGSFNEFED